MKILCIIGIHNWSDWKYIRPIGRWEERYRKECKWCSKSKIQDVHDKSELK